MRLTSRIGSASSLTVGRNVVVKNADQCATLTSLTLVNLNQQAVGIFQTSMHIAPIQRLELIGISPPLAAFRLVNPSSLKLLSVHWNKLSLPMPPKVTEFLPTFSGLEELEFEDFAYNFQMLI